MCVGSGSALLFMPWFLRTFQGSIMDNIGQQLRVVPEQLTPFAQQYNAIGNLSVYMALSGWLLLAVAIGVGLWRRQHGTLVLVVWCLLLFVAANPDWLRLPGSGVISNFALFIAIYIPAGAFIGDLFGRFAAHLRSRWLQALAAILVVALSLGSVRTRLNDVAIPQHTLVTRPDIRAMAWIQAHTPQDARFLVNSSFAYGGSYIVGSDAGWWVPLLAGRANTLPPLTYSMEQGPQPDYREWVNRLTRQLIDKGIDDPSTLTLLQERGITYVYIGERQGHTNYAGDVPLAAKKLLDSPHYRSVYHQDGVWIFEIATSV